MKKKIQELQIDDELKVQMIHLLNTNTDDDIYSNSNNDLEIDFINESSSDSQEQSNEEDANICSCIYKNNQINVITKEK